MDAIPFLNREWEMQCLQDMLSPIETRALLITAQEGLGKTTLLREFATLLRAKTHHLIVYQVVQPEVGLSPTLLDAELNLQRAIDRWKLVSGDAFRTNLGEALRRKVRATGSGIERLHSGTTLEEVTSSFSETLIEASQRLKVDQLLVLLFDLQPGLDTRSEQALIGLSRSLPRGVRLILASPNTENGSGMKTDVPQLRLGMLTKDHTRAILHACIDSHPVDLFETSWKHFKGYPLAIVTLARLLQNGWPGSASALPTSLSALFDLLLDDLDPLTRRLIQVLAILFEPADVATIAKIGGLAPRAVERIVSQDRVVRLLEQEYLSQRQFQLSHPLLNKHVVQQSSDLTLRQLHGEAAKHYGYDFETYWHNPRTLGYCLEHLRVSDPLEYVRFVTSSETRVLLQIWGAIDLASFHLQQALKTAADKPERLRIQLISSDDTVTLREMNTLMDPIHPQSLLLRDLGYFSRLDGSFATASEYYQRALQALKDDERSAQSTVYLNQQAEIWMEMAELYRAQSMHNLALDALEKARNLYDLLYRTQSNDIQRWAGRLGRCWHNIGVMFRDVGLRERQNEMLAEACRSFHKALEAFQRALGLAEEESVQVDELLQLGYGHFELAEINKVLEEHTQEAKLHLREATHAYEEALASARHIGDLEAIAIASGNLSSLSLQAGLLGEAVRHAQAAVDAFEQLGMIEAVDQARTLLAQAQAQLAR